MAFARSALVAVAKSSVASTATSTTAKSTAAKDTPKIAKGISKPVPVSSALSNFIGATQVSRTSAVKKVWEYIKLNNLQKPENRKLIYCDEKLKTIFEGKDEVDIIEIAKLLSKHFVKTT